MKWSLSLELWCDTHCSCVNTEVQSFTPFLRKKNSNQHLAAIYLCCIGVHSRPCLKRSIFKFHNDFWPWPCYYPFSRSNIVLASNFWLNFFISLNNYVCYCFQSSHTCSMSYNKFHNSELNIIENFAPFLLRNSG